MVKKKSRASTSRARGAKKVAPKRAKKSTVKSKASTRRALATSQVREGLDVKKLRDDLQKAITVLQRRIDQGDPALRLPETRDLFKDWVRDIEATVCADVNGPCGSDMFVGS